MCGPVRSPSGAVSGCALLAVLGASASITLADTVILDNGDRITGRIQRAESGKVIIATDYAGEIGIDWAHIETLTSDEAMTVNLDDATRVYGKLAMQGGIIDVTSPDGLSQRSVPVKQVEAVAPGNMLKDQLITSGQLNIGGSRTSGNTQNSIVHIDGELVARQGPDRYTVGALFNRATDRGAETAENAKLYAKYDRFFAKKWYGTINTTFEHDPFADIQLRTTAGVGIGYQALASARTNLALESGVDYVETNHYQLPTESYPAVRLALKFDSYLIPDRLQVFQGTELYIARGQDEPSFARTQTGLRVPVWKKFVANLQYNVDWNSNPPPGFESIDRTLIFSLGYRW